MKKMFVTEPYLLTLSPSSEMNIVWIQCEPLEGEVEYGVTEDLNCYVKATCYKLTGIRVPASENGYTEIPEENPEIPLWQCIATLKNLQPGQRIYYRCIAGQYTTKTYHFHTAPMAGEPYRFAQLSDLQGNRGCDEVMREISQEKPDFLLYSGDCIRVVWQASDWFDMEEPWQDRISAKCAFFPCLQQSGTELLQHCPIFICPGNHEVDDLRVSTVKEIAEKDENFNWSVYMQIFRSYYNNSDTSLTGKRWYSVDYSDMHIVSLSVQRIARWSAYETPGWRLTDSIAPDSPQIKWLKQDLENTTSKFKWVIFHWHILNKGDDVQPNLCQPQIDEKGNVTYPYNHGEYLMNLFKNYGVNAVSYGHSHVYERYFWEGTHYIEAAHFTICYRQENAPIHPSGLTPVVEDNSKNSFLVIEREEGGLFGNAYYAASRSEEKFLITRHGKDPRIFDSYQIADENEFTGYPLLKAEV